MKLKSITIQLEELQDYLDKYQEKIKFIIFVPVYTCGMGPNQLILVIDEA